MKRGEEGMLCREVMERIERAYPGSSALEWDNVGLLVGREDKEVKRIYVALDATNEVIEAAIRTEADMLVTHHPLIFGGLKQVTNRNFIGARVLKLARCDISYYAMHTNYDVKRMAGLSCEMLHMEGTEILEVTDVCENGMEEGIGRIADVEQMSLGELCEKVKRVFKIDALRVFGDLDISVGRIAVCPGSGKSVIEIALKKGADVLVTGDIGHHEGIDAWAQGMAVVDAGHYGIEHIFVDDMKQYLEKNVPGAKVWAAVPCYPFITV